MTTLRDPFMVIHKKEVETKTGILRLDYVTWSQVADRLDEASPGWTFQIRQLGEDWCWGALTIDGRIFENVGYAENADLAWKKEALKDAVSDALKRCAAMAGVARYLYDKEAPANGHAAPPRPVAVPQPLRTPQDDPYPDDLAGMTPIAVVPVGGGQCPTHHMAWTLRPAGVSKTTGKPYAAFYACPSAERPYCTQKPSLAWVGSQGVPA